MDFLKRIDKVHNEAGVKRLAKVVFNELGMTKFYMPVQMTFGENGASDFLLCYRGIYFAIETKFGDNYVKKGDNQDKFGQEVLRAGGVFGVFNEKNLPSLKEWIQRSAERAMRMWFALYEQEALTASYFYGIQKGKEIERGKYE